MGGRTREQRKRRQFTAPKPHSFTFLFALLAFASILSPMNLLPFDTLPAHKPRRFVPEKIDLGDWKPLAPLFDRLESLAAQCHSAADLERWLLDARVLSAAPDADASRRDIALSPPSVNI